MLKVECSNISRQQLLQEYEKSPESAPLKVSGFVSTMAAKEYRFEIQMTRFSSLTAGGLVDEAHRDAEMVKKGYGLSLTKGLVAICAGAAAYVGTPAFPPLFLAVLFCFYFAMTWIRQGTDKIRQSRYDQRFVADVVCYSDEAITRTSDEAIPVAVAPHRDKPYTLEIGYVCIFTKTTEEAAQNLIRLIVKRECGFDEGAAAWRDILQVHLSPPDELCQLNQAGANFTAAEWRLILEQVHAELLTDDSTQ